MASSTSSQDQMPNSPSLNPNMTTQGHDQAQTQQQQGNLLPSDDTQSPKTLSLKIPNPQNDDDPEDITLFSPTISDSHMSATATIASSRRVVGGGRKRKKGGPKRRGQEKKCQKKLEILTTTLKPIPFVPIKNLDFSSHEALLKRLGLWDFVHVRFDLNLRADLIAQLIASYNPSLRCSYVNGVRILVNRTDLGRALNLPVKKDKGNVGDNAMEVKESEESIGFIEALVSNWVLLHEDTWMMPVEVLNLTKVIKEGSFERVDWAGLLWFMVEKELTAAPNLGNCYYASHLQHLIKGQREELLKEAPVRMEVDVKEDEEDEDVRMGEEIRGGSELEEHNIELSLGGLDNVVKDDGEKEGTENVCEENAMDFEESKEEEEQGNWLNSTMDGQLLRPCTLGDVGGVPCEEERKVDELEGEGEVEGEGEGEGEGGGEEEEEEEEGEGEGEGKEGEEGEEREEMGFSISPKGDSLDGVHNENLIAAMEAADIPFSSGVQIHDNISSGEFLASRVDTQTITVGSLHFGNVNGNKREIGHLDNDMPHHSLNGGSKRMRSDGSWDMKSSSDFDVYVEQMQHVMGKARMAYLAKEQANQEMSMNQQLLLKELQQRDNMIQHLHKAMFEEQQKRQVEAYRLERELYMMGNLLEGYRKALKETHKAFAEYRAKCPLHEEPIYKDAGAGGIVLSTMELEKRRLMQEEEEGQNLLLTGKKVKEFEAGWIVKFEAYNGRLDLLGSRLLNIGQEISLIKQTSEKRKTLTAQECAPTEE